MDLPLAFEPITEGDIPELTQVMTRAFDDDARKYQGRPRGGPDGYDNGEFFRKWLFGRDETVGYKAISAGRIVGGMVLWLYEDGENTVGVIFVDPACQDCGVGTRLWQFGEQRHAARSWRLETPAWAVKNHAFYERKCGFQRIAVNPGDGPTGEMYVYGKTMGRTGAPA